MTTPGTKKVSKRGRVGEGRPSKYKPEYCEQIVEFMREGRSIIEFAASIGVVESTVHLWAVEITEFSEAKKLALEASLAWWERRLRDLAVTDKGNATATIFRMKNFRGSAYAQAEREAKLAEKKAELEIERLNLEIERLKQMRTPALDFSAFPAEALEKLERGELSDAELLKYITPK